VKKYRVICCTSHYASLCGNRTPISIPVSPNDTSVASADIVMVAVFDATVSAATGAIQPREITQFSTSTCNVTYLTFPLLNQSFSGVYQNGVSSPYPSCQFWTAVWRFSLSRILLLSLNYPRNKTLIYKICSYYNLTTPRK